VRGLAKITLFIALSLGVHWAVAAVWQGLDAPQMQRERSIGGAALQIGALVNSRVTVPPPVAVAPVMTTPAESLPAITPDVTARNAIVAKLPEQTPVPTEPRKAEAVKARQMPVETKQTASEPVPQRQPTSVPEQKTEQEPQKAPQTAAVPSNLDQARGGVVTSTKGQRDMISGNGGVRVTAGGEDDISDYRGRVREKLVSNKFYPNMAKRFRFEGVVTFAFTLSRDGQASGLRVLKSSGHALLDKAALRTVELSVPFEKFPPLITAQTMDFQFPISFTLD
jgi:protein TonB